jgi:type III restriction enzyme
VSEPVINVAALEPLFAPHEEPNQHRARAQGDQPAQTKKGRRPSKIAIAQSLRSHVKQWRETDYPGASDTTRELLHHWFGRDHLIEASGGLRVPFRYYFCQREAMETLIYLYEVRGIRSLTPLVGEFGGPSAETAALGVNPDDDRWAKYAFKLATGAGKTKVMSLAIVWSYFHALRESNSPMAKHFVVVAPNLTVFERLKTDFKPAEGGKDIFDNDPLIPVAWRGDWNLSVVLQDEASGAATGGTLYLTNIHRLYDHERRKKEAETYDWMGPTVSRAKALDTGAELRKRITGHERVMILNDEAHHLWDSSSAANEAISYLHETIASRTGAGLVAQLDFSATPKDDNGQMFQHVVCDTPLGEAVDGGIVKTPIIGKGKGWVERTSTDASERYEEQLRVGYARWLKSKEEWQKSGKKPLLFVMTEDTEAANQIADRMNTDPVFKELNKKTVNLHTNLKGKVKWVGGRTNGYPVFEESEKEISDDDLKALRELSRQIDSDQNPYSCIVSVLMLREGWDVRNVTTIVPLRPYTSKANILPEQTLGRGLRRMTPPGEAAELVTVVEHPAFVSLYAQELEQEGLFIETIDVEHIPKTTVTIFPDKEHKDFAALDIVLPEVSGGFSRTASLEGLTLEEPQLTLVFGETRAEDAEEFISKADFSGLPPAHQKMVQQAISLFRFLENKAGQSFAPVFTPLLGPLDEASRAVMLKLLGTEIPTEREAQNAFFEPDLSQLSEKDAEMYRRRGKDLKRTLVDHNGMSPIGLLRWCLQYSRKPNIPAGAIFEAVNRHFSSVPEDIYKLVSDINTFRNNYVAHQEKELTDFVVARKALGEWTSGLRRIWELHH